MEPLLDRLNLVDRHATRAAATAAEDAGASPITRAVLEEFRRKLSKAHGVLVASPSPTAAREAIVEAEQAADSAVVAALADAGANDATKKAVELAHKSLCVLKFENASEPSS
jgi:hypothetical protein